MAFKFIILSALVAYASAGLIPAAPVAYAAAPIGKTVLTKVTDAEYDPNPQYSYSYDVADSLTGDFKAQSETRNGDVVQGQYSLLEADGTRRVVDYAADPLNGFNAVVRKEPVAVAAPVAKVAVAAAPIAKFAPAPIAVAAPIAKFAPAPAPAPLAYAAPAPLAYGAPAFAAPAPLAYSAPAFAAPAALPAYGSSYNFGYSSPAYRTFY